MKKTKLLEKLKNGRCIVCRCKVLKKDFHYCEYDSCPMGEMCKSCAETHKKGHILENSVSEECDILLNSLTGKLALNTGNATGLF